MIEYGINTLGKGFQVFVPVTLGFPSRDKIGKTGFIGTPNPHDITISSRILLHATRYMLPIFM